MTKRLIDLRSDTITQPDAEMRKVMASALVGDDVLGDDYTVKAFEKEIADFLGKEAALFVPSGTMANQLAIRCHTNPGDEMIIDANAHIYWYEAGAPAALSGVTCKQINGINGIFTKDDVLLALRPENDHFPPTSLLTIENTHNRGGGAVWPVEIIKEVTDFARENGLKTHLDGARLWNAAIASGISERTYASFFDSISVCFSKGLGAPIGSALIGSAEFIKKARRFRKQFGGGMRQVGIIAAAARYAFQNNRMRLGDDHLNAKELALGLNGIAGISLDLNDVKTNMVYFDLLQMPASEFVEKLEQKGVRVLNVSPVRIRAVPNLMVSREDISAAIRAIKELLS